jgi:hypothetical protein
MFTCAQEQGIARLSKNRESLYAEASQTIREARETVQVLMREGLIRKAPEE